MKKSFFIDYRLLAGLFIGGILLVAYCPCLCIYIMGSIKGLTSKEWPIEFFVVITLFFLVLGIGLFWLIRYLCRRTASWLIIVDNKIIWRCPFYKTAKINLENCHYVGLEDMNEHRIAMPVSRGDELSYIYLSTQPFPSKYKHKADEAKCENDFIVFIYSDKLCKTLIEILPEEKTHVLKAFYEKMQEADIRLAKEKEKCQRKKLREKEKEKKRKEKQE